MSIELATPKMDESIERCMGKIVHILCCGPLWLSARHGPDDVAVPRVGDGEGADPEVLAAGGPELIVVAGVVMDASLGQHGVVLDLGLAERWSVVGDDHQFGLSTPAIDETG